MDNVTPIRTRHRAPRTTTEQPPAPAEVPIDVQVAQLKAVLNDPTLVGWHDDARRALAQLATGNALAA